jgi:hypothetical protein
MVSILPPNAVEALHGQYSEFVVEAGPVGTHFPANQVPDACPLKFIFNVVT